MATLLIKNRLKNWKESVNKVKIGINKVKNTRD